MMIKVVCLLFLFLLVPAAAYAGPASTHYELKNYGFGTGGGQDLSSTHYKAMGTLGEIDGASSSSTNYSVNGGLSYTINASVPNAPTVSNPANYYDKLQLTITPLSDATTNTSYAIEASTDNFVSNISYVQNNNTLGAALGPEDFQSYTSWGGASGTQIIGLSPNTTYSFRVAAQTGTYTQSGFGPSAQAATTNSSLSFDIDIGGSSDPGETAEPYSISFGSLSLGSVTTASNRVWIDLSTNADNGGYVYIYDQNSGLKSSSLNYTIAAVSNNLDSVEQGYGIQGTSVTQSSGGPLDIVSPYNGSGNTVGTLSTASQELFSASSPITSGRGSFAIKAKAAPTTPASSDYSDTLTIIAASTF